jgi:hypothetical protein
MAEESISYDKYEVQSLLNLTSKSEFKLERIFTMYKVYGAKHFYYNILKKIQIPEKIAKSKYFVYISKPNDVWTMISFKFYNRIDLWWLIAMFNGIDDTFTPLEANTELVIPTPEYVREVLSSIKAQV